MFLFAFLLLGCEDTDAQADITELQEALDALQTQVDAQAQTIETQEQTISELNSRLVSAESNVGVLQDDVDLIELLDDVQEGELETLFDRVDGHDDDLAGLEADFLAQGTSLAALQGEVDDVVAETDDLFAYVSVDTSDDSVVFSGANVFVQSGAGSTDATVNGLGNLIVGYSEGGTSTGSHNLVVGMYHTYPSYGGVVFGYHNNASGIYSTVLGGEESTASGAVSTIVGGYINTASGNYSVVYGGQSQSASDDYEYSP